MNAIQMLKQDHEKVRKLFREYADSDHRSREKRDAAQQALMELEIHSKLEEEIFYPAVRQTGDELRESVEEGYAEHREVDRLVEELKAMDPSTGQFGERFQALIGAVEHHVAEEVGEMLPKAEGRLGGEADRLGQEMTRRREALMRELMPSTERSRM